jgi:hypothetical protein
LGCHVEYVALSREPDNVPASSHSISGAAQAIASASTGGSVPPTPGSPGSRLGSGMRRRQLGSALRRSSGMDGGASLRASQQSLAVPDRDFGASEGSFADRMSPGRLSRYGSILWLGCRMLQLDFCGGFGWTSRHGIALHSPTSMCLMSCGRRRRWILAVVQSTFLS